MRRLSICSLVFAATACSSAYQTPAGPPHADSTAILRDIAYLASDASYDVTTRDAFVSMPSGHSALAFAAASVAATDNLLVRPTAGTAEHVAVASLGAMLAGFTGNLRVRADQHFPTDALVGSLIGTASGVSVPMLHEYLLPGGRHVPHPGGHAWLMSAGGYVVGAALGVGLSSLVY